MEQLEAKSIPDQLRPKFDTTLHALIDKLVPLLAERDGAGKIAAKLQQLIPIDAIVAAAGQPRGAQVLWEWFGHQYPLNKQYSQPEGGLQIFTALYMHLLRAQKRTRQWTMKGMPLVRIAECYRVMQQPCTALRFLMLTLIEDAIRGKGEISPNNVGSYFRLVWSGLLPERDFHRYAQEAFARFKRDKLMGLFPEWILQNFDHAWMNQTPSALELTRYNSNPLYIKELMGQLGKTEGHSLERLAEYLLSSIPGCRTYRRQRTHTSDIDVVCAIDGPELDFRANIGRYFACECKDWGSKSLDVSTVKQFSQALQLINARFGILFCPRSVSGIGKNRHAELEQRIVYQHLGIIVVALDRFDLKALAEGASLTSLLRRKYEEVRLNLPIDTKNLHRPNRTAGSRGHLSESSSGSADRNSRRSSRAAPGRSSTTRRAESRKRRPRTGP